MHALSRTLSERTLVTVKSSNLQKLVTSRTVTSTTKNNAASAQQTQDERQEAKAKKMKKAVHSKSFVQNIFRGIVEPEQAFPYPNTLDQDQRDTLEMLVPITEKFFMEQNDPLKIDDNLEKGKEALSYYNFECDTICSNDKKSVEKTYENVICPFFYNYVC